MKVISAVIPCYNSEAYMEKAINTLLSGGEDMEIIVVDDCSTDATRLLLDDYAKRDSRICVLSTERNSGASAARCKGLAVARGEYITEVDADDWLATDAIAIAAEEAAKNLNKDLSKKQRKEKKYKIINKIKSIF